MKKNYLNKLLKKEMKISHCRIDIFLNKNKEKF